MHETLAGALGKECLLPGQFGPQAKGDKVENADEVPIEKMAGGLEAIRSRGQLMES